MSTQTRTSDFLAKPGGVMTDEVGAVTGDLTLCTEAADDGSVRVLVQYIGADEWYREPAPPDEIAARVRTALVRSRQNGAALVERVERTEYEHMLHDTLTGLPT